MTFIPTIGKENDYIRDCSAARFGIDHSTRISGDSVGLRTVYGKANFDNVLASDNHAERAEFSVAGQRVAQYIKGDPTVSDGIKHIYADHLGSTGAMSDGNGYINASRVYYYPFGDFRNSPTGATPMLDSLYIGHHGNNLPNAGADDLGLIRMNARYYVSGIGRFASADTIVPDPANYNRYSYSYNNPVKYTDPSGHCVFAPPYDTLACIVVLTLSLTHCVTASLSCWAVQAPVGFLVTAACVTRRVFSSMMMKT